MSKVSPTEIAVELARENKRLKIENERLKAEVEQQKAEKSNKQ